MDNRNKERGVGTIVTQRTGRTQGKEEWQRARHITGIRRRRRDEVK